MAAVLRLRSAQLVRADNTADQAVERPGLAQSGAVQHAAHQQPARPAPGPAPARLHRTTVKPDSVRNQVSYYRYAVVLRCQVLLAC